jgi:allantoate deiminase
MISRAQSIVDACRTIAQFSEDSENITRTYLSPPTRRVHAFLQSWMDRLGLESWIDAAGNLRGLYRGRKLDPPRLLLGSHIDTVPNSGAFDGVLGVVMAMALVEELGGHRLDYDVEVIAFSEEEGVRFRVPFIGSRALTGEIDQELLNERDAHGTTLAEAIRAFGLDPAAIVDAAMHPETFAFLEFHIEQGPVLEDLDMGLGIVEAIVGQSRYDLTFYGKANHAGTTPMRLRQDALAGAAEWILAAERLALATPGLVATVGRVHATPGVANVIPGEARVSLDIRHANDAIRLTAVENLMSEAYGIASRRSLSLSVIQHFDQPATAMNPLLADALESAAIETGSISHRMVSGAGHDAVVIARKLPTAMLFLRSPGGISHHPDEAVLLDDVQAALAAGLYFLKHLEPAAVNPPALQDTSGIRR